MFVGHYGVSFALRPEAKRVPLWVWFIAVQWMDIVWSVLVVLGVEKVRIVPGFTEANALDLYYMPYTHGLPGSIVLSLNSWRDRIDVYLGKSRKDGASGSGRLILALGYRSPGTCARSASLRQYG